MAEYIEYHFPIFFDKGFALYEIQKEVGFHHDAEAGCVAQELRYNMIRWQRELVSLYHIDIFLKNTQPFGPAKTLLSVKL